MNKIANVVREWALQDGDSSPQFHTSDDGGFASYRFSICNEQETLLAYLDAREDVSQLVFFVYMEEGVPEDRWPAVSELLTRLNNDEIYIGNFELSLDKGLIRFRAGMPVEAESLSLSMVESLVRGGMGTMMKFLPTIRATALGNVSPEVACLAAKLPKALRGRMVDASEAPAWNNFSGTQVLQRWSRQVIDALADEAGTDEETWWLIGRAIVIEHEYPSVGDELALRLAHEIGLPLVRISAGEIENLLAQPAALETVAPLMLYFEAGTWQKCEDDDDLDESAREAQGRVCSLLRSFNPSRPVICVTVTQSIERMHSSLLGQNGFNRRFILPSLPPLEAGNLMIEMIGKERCAASITDTPAKVGKLMSYEFENPGKRKLAALRLRRLFAENNQPLEFLDLVRLHSNGLAESDQPAAEAEEARRYVALHEAGHACIAIIDSGGCDIPEYSSIVPSAAYRGIVVDSLSYIFARDGLNTFQDFRHGIRVSLAGRAAEELAFGPMGISSGSRSDLEKCTCRAMDAFGVWGFTPNMGDNAGESSRNLAVVIGKPSITEQAHVEKLVRHFLEKEYQVVLETLRKNRLLLDAIRIRLESCAVLDQADLLGVCRKADISLESAILVSVDPQSAPATATAP